MISSPIIRTLCCVISAAVIAVSITCETAADFADIVGEKSAAPSSVLATGDYIFNRGSDESVKISGSVRQHTAFSEQNVSEFGEALNIKPLCCRADGWVQIPAEIYDCNFDFYASSGIAMYVKIPINADFTNINLRLIKKDWSKDWYSIGLDHTYTFVTLTEGKITKKDITQHLPFENMQGFEGFVFIPYGTLTDGSDLFDISKLSATGWTIEISMYYENSEGVAEDYYFDEIGFYSNPDTYVQKCLSSLESANYIFDGGNVSLYGGSDILITSVSDATPFGAAVSLTPTKVHGGGWARIPAAGNGFSYEAVRGIAMYVSIPEDAVGCGISVRLANSSWSEWFTLGYEKEILLIGADGRREKTSLELSAALAGYNGFVFIPFESMTDGSLLAVVNSHLGTDDWNFEIGFYARSEKNTGIEYFFDEIGYYSDETEYIRHVRNERLGFSFEFTQDGFVLIDDADVTVGELQRAVGTGFYDSVYICIDGEPCEATRPAASGEGFCFVKKGGDVLSYRIAKLYDISCDGDVDVRDYIRLKKCVAGTYEFSAPSLRACSKQDVTAKSAGAAELAELKKRLLGLNVQRDNSQQQNFSITSGGKATCKIVINKSSSAAQLAAQDLAERIFEMTGVTVPIVADTLDISSNMILVGKSTKTDELGLEIPSGFPENEGFRVYSDSRVLLLAGNDEGSFTGTQFAVNYLLELLGFGWYGTDSLWTVIPQVDEVSVPHINILSRPDFGSRYTNLSKAADTLSKRWYLGGYNSEVEHKFPIIFPVEKYYAEHPEYYALSNGTRSTEGKRWWQLCLSNPEVQRITAGSCIEFFRTHPYYNGVSNGQNDGNGDPQSADYANWCECDDCKHFAGSFTEAMMRFSNIVGGLVAEEFPDKTVMYYGYYETFEPPSTQLRAEENVLLMLCKQGGLTRFAGYENLFNSYMGDAQFSNVFKGWRQLGYKHIGIYEWNCPGAASEAWKNCFWVQGDVFIENARWFRNFGVDFIKIDQGPNSVYEREENYFDIRWPLWYVNSVSMYYCGRSFEEIMRPVCDKLYGDAAGAMYEFYDALNKANRYCEAPNVTWALPDVGSVYTSAHVARIDKAIERAREVGVLIGGEIDQRIENQYSNWIATKSYL